MRAFQARCAVFRTPPNSRREGPNCFVHADGMPKDNDRSTKVGDVIAAQAILDAVRKPDGISFNLIRALLDKPPLREPVRPGSRFAMNFPGVGQIEVLTKGNGKGEVSMRGQVHEIDLDDEFGETYGRCHPWLILYHLAGMPFVIEGDGDARRVDPALRRHLEAIDDANSVVAAATVAPAAAPSDPSSLGRVRWLWVGGFAVYVALVVLYFMRGATWAATSLPDPAVAAQSLDDVKARLLALDDPKLPFKVSAAQRADELIVDWRFGDAIWLDFARARHLSQAFRYRLRLEPDTQTVRVLEYSARFEASAGWNATALSFSAQRGITFFEKRTETVFGVQLNRQAGGPWLHHTWTFNLDEMRMPLRDTVLAGGWTWKQVMLIAPWLTG